MKTIRKPLKCRQCREPFTPFHPMQIVCGYVCRQAYDRAQEFKRIRREQRAGRERLKTRRDHEKEAQRAFNAYIRERDKFDACISCGRMSVAKQNAGHYRSVAAAPQLRFNEDNCHKQCEQCNSWKSGNALDYRIRLISKIGLARVEALENHNAVAKRDTETLKAIRREYQVKLRVLKQFHESPAEQAIAAALTI